MSKHLRPRNLERSRPSSPSLMPENNPLYRAIIRLRSDVSLTNSQSSTCERNCAGNGGVSVDGGSADGGSVVISGDGDDSVSTGNGGSVIINNEGNGSSGDDDTDSTTSGNSNSGGSDSAGTGDDAGDVGATVVFSFPTAPDSATSSGRTSSDNEADPVTTTSPQPTSISTATTSSTTTSVSSQSLSSSSDNTDSTSFPKQSTNSINALPTQSSPSAIEAGPASSSQPSSAKISAAVTSVAEPDTSGSNHLHGNSKVLIALIALLPIAILVFFIFRHWLKKRRGNSVFSHIEAFSEEAGDNATIDVASVATHPKALEAFGNGEASVRPSLTSASHTSQAELRSPEGGLGTNTLQSSTIDPSTIRDQVVSMLYREVLDLRARVTNAERQSPPAADVDERQVRRSLSLDTLSTQAPPTYHEH